PSAPALCAHARRELARPENPYRAGTLSLISMLVRFRTPRVVASRAEHTLFGSAGHRIKKPPGGRDPGSQRVSRWAVSGLAARDVVWSAASTAAAASASPRRPCR